MSNVREYLIKSSNCKGYRSVEVVISDTSTPLLQPQYVATITAALSALASGIVIGWTSPIAVTLQSGLFHDISITGCQMSWIGSIAPLGACLACIPTGFICDIIGRRKTLLLLIIPYTIGWLFLIFAATVMDIYYGRFILGIAIGACSVAAPLYISEIAHKDIRGTLGSYYQIMVTIGILYAYMIGTLVAPTSYTICCSIIPLVFLVTFFFQPESPTFYVKNFEYACAEKVLKSLRGPHYNIGAEMLTIEVGLTEGMTNIDIISASRERAFRKSMLISVSLMVFQQISGISAVIFYNSCIFEDANIQINAEHACIIVGLCQVVATFVSSLYVDRLGRKLLLTVSAHLMSFSMLLLGVFFLLKDHKLVSVEFISGVSFSPILALIMYIIVYSLGLGPIPWIISGEIFSPKIISVASSVSATVNWALAFMVTKSFIQIERQVGNDITFFFFSFVLLFASVYIHHTMSETKGKSIPEIQADLEKVFVICN